MPSREQYAAQRLGARYAERGETFILRHVNLLDGPVPYRNPPDTSPDVTITTGIRVGAQAFLGLAGSSAIGRFVMGDQILCLSPTGAVQTSWVVQTMPGNIATDVDGIPIAAPDGTPQIGSPAAYSPDVLAANDRWTVVPVQSLGTGNPDPAANIGQKVQFVFVADVPIYGTTMSIERMRSMGWTEIVSIGVMLAAYGPDGPITTAPKVDDQLIIDGKVRNILRVGDVNRRGVHFFFPVQAQ